MNSFHSDYSYQPYTNFSRGRCLTYIDTEGNIEFLEGIDCEYFSYVAEQNLPNIENENKHRAAISLRLAYSHGLESLFALLCSAVQAPQCSIGWLLNYKNFELTNIVKKISAGHFVHTRFKDQNLTWKKIAQFIHHNLGHDNKKKNLIIEGYGKIWTWMASEFTDENFTLEYNGIKHGLRINPGGFEIAIGKEKTFGVAPPAEKMVNLGGSEFGSSYFVKEFIADTPKTNFRPRRHSRNWNPTNIANRLALISMSINNVISWLKIINGVNPEKCQFNNPVELDHFKEPWKKCVGLSHSTFDLNIEKDHIQPFDKKDILASYENK